MRKDFLIYEERRKYLVIYEEAVSHIWLCDCSIPNFLIYEENFIFFLSVCVQYSGVWECHMFYTDCTSLSEFQNSNRWKCAFSYYFLPSLFNEYCQKLTKMIAVFSAYRTTSWTCSCVAPSTVRPTLTWRPWISPSTIYSASNMTPLGTNPQCLILKYRWEEYFF